MNKCSFIILYHIMRLQERVGLLLLVLCWDMTSRVRFADSRSTPQILERWEASMTLGRMDSAEHYVIKVDVDFGGLIIEFT